MVWYQRPSTKYGNKKTLFNGRHYDSKHEATVAQEINVLQKAGEITDVKPQHTFFLHGKNGGRVCSHRVDFYLTFKDGHEEVWEAKSVATMTAAWNIKRKLFEDNYPDIRYVVVTNKGNWYGSRIKNGQFVRNNQRSRAA